MAKRVKRTKRLTTKPVGKAIKGMIKKLRAIRADATAQEKKHIDLNIRVLDKSYASITWACTKDPIWVVPK